MKFGTTLSACIIALSFVLSAFATPSTELWTAGTADIQPYGIVHIGTDNYFTVARKGVDGAGAFPTDLGVTVGILPFEKIKLEIGLDYMEPGDFPLFFNAKAGAPEDAIFKGSPGIAIGIFNIGTEPKVTAQNIGYAAIGKTLPVVGRLFAGGYIGNKTVLGDKNSGVTLAWDRSFLPVKSAAGTDYCRIGFCADYASGKNLYGAGGFGFAWYFNENVSVLTGPVFFNDEAINGKWKWTVQLDANIPAF